MLSEVQIPGEGNQQTMLQIGIVHRLCTADQGSIVSGDAGAEFSERILNTHTEAHVVAEFIAYQILVVAIPGTHGFTIEGVLLTDELCDEKEVFVICLYLRNIIKVGVAVAVSATGRDEMIDTAVEIQIHMVLPKGDVGIKFRIHRLETALIGVDVYKRQV